MEVLVRKPPVFTIEPDSMYQRKVGETVEMHCDAQETEGTQKPTIQWQRVRSSCFTLCPDLRTDMEALFRLRVTYLNKMKFQFQVILINE